MAEPRDELYTHKPFISMPRSVALTDLGQGDVVSFTYKGKVRWQMVLNPNHFRKMHTLDLRLVNRRVLVNEVIARMDQTDQPKVLYGLAIREPVARRLDAYRTFNIESIQNITRYRYDLDPVQEAQAESFLDKNPNDSLSDDPYTGEQ